MKKDLRYIQIVFLTCFLLLGTQFLDWDIQLRNIVCLLAITILTQSLFCIAFKIPINALKSACITILAISLLLRSEQIFIYGMAGFFSISSKYIFKIKGKHLFNPANFGIVFIFLFTGLGKVTSDQISLIASFVIIFISISILVFFNMKKLDLTSYFLIFPGLDFLINGNQALDNIQSVSFLLFSLLIVLDPATSPNNKIMRKIWIFIIAFISIFIKSKWGLNESHYIALFIMSILTPVLDYFATKESKFSWDSMYRRELYSNT